MLLYLSYFSAKTYIVGTHLKHLTEDLVMSIIAYVFMEKLTEALVMRTHNICFHGEIRDVLMLMIPHKWSYNLA